MGPLGAPPRTAGHPWGPFGTYRTTRALGGGGPLITGVQLFRCGVQRHWLQRPKVTRTWRESPVGHRDAGRAELSCLCGPTYICSMSKENEKALGVRKSISFSFSAPSLPPDGTDFTLQDRRQHIFRVVIREKKMIRVQSASF